MAKKSAKKGKKGKGGRGRRKNKQSFNIYIWRVLKQVQPNVGISKKAMACMNTFVWDMYDAIATEAAKLTRYNKTKTLSARGVQAATTLCLPGELAKHAVQEGNKAVNAYNK